MEILTDKVCVVIQEKLINPALQKEYQVVTQNLPGIVDELHRNIPEQKRISYGLYYVIKELSAYLHAQLADSKAPIFEVAAKLFDLGDNFETKAIALGIISICGLHEYQNTLCYFEKAAISSDEMLREMAQAFFRKLIRKYPSAMKEYLLKLVKSEDPNLRRFVGETLRPAQENEWIYKDQEYSLSILRYLFKESAPYPRTSVGNNLSDLARRNPDLIFGIVAELVQSGDENSYWIAYRACRNLVTKDPLKVRILLKVNEYKYIHRLKKSNQDEIH